MKFNRVTCCGGGTIGSTWAVNFLIKGLHVTIYDLSDVILDRAREVIERNLAFFTEPDIKILTQEQYDECLTRITYTTDMKTAVENAQFIQENGPENLGIKRSIIKNIEQWNKTAIIASSTSGLLISEIAAEAAYPERVLAAHPYTPVHLIPLVELTKGPKTSEETMTDAEEFYREIGKEPVVLKKECLGFICNRIQAAASREAQDLVYRGICSVEDADKAMVFGPGIRWGILGVHMLAELGGGAMGARGLSKLVGPTMKSWYEDMASWTEPPAESFDEIEETLAKRPPEQGNDILSLERFRNRGLVTLLKFHGKL